MATAPPGRRYESAAQPLRDRIRPGVRALFVGINPGLRSAALGHHFAGHSNRFWKLLYEAGLVPEPVTFLDDHRLPEWGYGITNLVPRPTAGVSDLTDREMRAGRRVLLAKVRRYHPEVVVLLGVMLRRVLLEGEESRLVGLQSGRLAGAPVLVLPNPSGRNAHYRYADMRRLFVELKRFLEGRRGDGIRGSSASA